MLSKRGRKEARSSRVWRHDCREFPAWHSSWERRWNCPRKAGPPHSPTPVPVLTVSGAADAKANSLQLDEVFTRAFREADRDAFRVDIQSDEQ